jgi:hypothetical protein
MKVASSIYYSLSLLKVTFSSPSSCFLTFLLLLTFKQPFSYNHGIENNIVLRKTIHRNIATNMKWFGVVASTQKGKGVHVALIVANVVASAKGVKLLL